MSETDKEDMEATKFAMELLMPVELMKQEVGKLRQHDICDDKWVKDLAKKFRVPFTMMAIRLGDLRSRGDL